MLRDQSLSIAEISNLVGFTDQSYFDKRFGTFRQIAARMPGNGKIVVKKGKIFLAALARRPQYFGLIKNAWRIRARRLTRVIPHAHLSKCQRSYG